MFGYGQGFVPFYIASAPAGGEPSETVVATDNFNRADGYIGVTNWTRVSPEWYNSYVRSNTLQQSNCGYNAMDYYSNATFSNDQYAKVKVVSIESGKMIGVCVRVSGTTGYVMRAESGTSIRLYSFTDVDTYTAIGDAITQTVTADDVLSLWVVGTTFYLRLNNTTLDTRTDATYNSGKPGVLLTGACGGNASTLDDFEGGDL
jgi:hypothetical protein